MEYLSSLLDRKFSEAMGKLSDSVSEIYNEFLLTQDDVITQEASKIIVPLDYYVKSIPEKVLNLFKLYNAEVVLVYVIDHKMTALISDVLGTEAGDTYIEKNRITANALFSDIGNKLNAAGLKFTTKVISDYKDLKEFDGDNVITAISKACRTGREDGAGLSYTALKMAGTTQSDVILY